MTNKDKCKGCQNIQEQNFPFTEADGIRLIDQENCGIEGEEYLMIKYCPVCGKLITRNNDRTN